MWHTLTDWLLHPDTHLAALAASHGMAVYLLLFAVIFRNEKSRGTIRGFFMGAPGNQAFLRMNSPIIGQMISRQRRPEKMP